jgi:hypothetical protein
MFAWRFESAFWASSFVCESAFHTDGFRFDLSQPLLLVLIVNLLVGLILILLRLVRLPWVIRRQSPSCLPTVT